MGIIYAITANAIFVFTNFFIQKAAKRLNIFLIIYEIGIFLFIINFLAAKYKKIPIVSTNPKTTKMLFFRTTITPFGAILIVVAFSLNAISECTAVQMTTPAFTAILARIILGEPYDLMLFLNTLLCFTGVLFISKPSFLFGEGATNAQYPQRSFGVLLTLTGAFVSSFGHVANKKLGELVNPMVNTLHFALFLCIMSAVMQIVGGIGEVYMSDVTIIAIVAVLQCGAHNLTNKSFSLGNTATISLMMYSQVFLAYFIDVVFKGVQLDFYSVVGALSIFLCMFITLSRLRMQNKSAK